MSDEGKKVLRCSFCGKREQQVHRMIQGPGVRICDECNFGSLKGRCVVCNAPGVADAYYCKECVMLEKDRDGCPKIINVGSAKTDMFYDRKKYEFSV